MGPNPTQVPLTDIINNGRAPSESDMSGNDNIVIDKPDQRSALDQDCDRKFQGER